jgi:hypothetical protein
MMVYASLSSLSLLSGIKQHHDNVGGDWLFEYCKSINKINVCL